MALNEKTEKCRGQCFRHHIECEDCNHTLFVGGAESLDTYCKIPSKKDCPCELEKCFNYPYCRRKVPGFLLDLNNELCLLCAVNVGKIYFDKKKHDKCPICWEEKTLYMISCQAHSFCQECWVKHCSMNHGSCPLCRKSIWAWKQTKSLIP